MRVAISTDKSWNLEVAQLPGIGIFRNFFVIVLQIPRGVIMADSESSIEVDGNGVTGASRERRDYPGNA
jgi:hypothetical protein